MKDDNQPVTGNHDAIVTTLTSVVPGASFASALLPDCNCNVQPELPAQIRCPFPNDQPLSKADQRKARADVRCADPYGNSMTSWGVENGAAAGPMLGLSGPSLSAAAAALDRGNVVVTNGRYIDGAGQVELSIRAWSDQGTASSPRTVHVPAITANAPGLRTMLIPASMAGTLGMKFNPYAVVAEPPAPLDQKQTDALNGALLAAGLNQAEIESGPPVKNNSIALILALAAGLIALGAAAIATGLAAADSRGDLTTLGAVGATPRVRRQLSLAQSGVIAFLGSALGVIAGFGAAAAVITGLNRVWSAGWPAPPPYPIEVPWLNLVVSLLIVPAVAMLGAGLLTRSRLPSERRAD
jgi:putative ABC transport system permease protein